MGKVSFTINQQKAIDVREKTVLVSAAAGSGKTAVLTQHVIDCMTKPPYVSANKMVVVTFTSASAIEMKERIHKNLQELIQSEPDNSLYQTQQVLLENAKICTIHSMCNEIIKNNFQSLNISPNYRIGDSNELKIIKEECIENIINKHYDDEDETFLKLVNFLYKKDDSKLVTIITSVYDFVRSYPFSLDMLDEQLERMENTADVFDTVWGNIVQKDILDKLSLAKIYLDSAISDLELDDKVKKAYFESMDEDLHMVDTLIKRIEENNWEKSATLAKNYKKPRLKSVRDYQDKDFLERVKSKRSNAMDIFDDICSSFFSISQEDFNEDLKILKEHTQIIFDLVREFYESVEQEKKTRNFLDFSDLEHLTLQLLVEKQNGRYVKTKIAKSLSDDFFEIIVDECQDVNNLQNIIFWALSNSSDSVNCAGEDILTDSKNLFMVGDAKQSIYRFRNAVPEIFVRKTEIYDKDSSENDCQKIMLSNNFRSRESVCNGVNHIFSRIMSKSLGDIDYGTDEELIPSAKYIKKEDDFCEFHILETKKESNLQEARYIAKLINKMILSGFEVEDKGKLRPCNYSDFCVLLRSKKNKAQNFIKAFDEEKIDFHTTETDGYFNSVEVSTVLNILRIIDNPISDIPLFSVLISPIFMFTPDEIAKIRLNDKKTPLYLAMVMEANDNNDEKCKHFLTIINELRKCSVTMSLYDLIQKIYDETGFLNIVGAMVAGEQKKNNLRLLMSYAQSYEDIGNMGLDGFLRFVDKAVDRDDDFNSANVLSSESDSVTLMSIHGSKGLEFPICILADCDKKFNLQDINKSFMFTQKTGFAMNIAKPQTLQEYTNIPLKSAKIATLNETLSEEMRILYVALTRAKEKLIMVASGTNMEKKQKELMNNFSVFGKLNSKMLSLEKSYSNWIFMSLLEIEDGNVVLKNTPDIQVVMKTINEDESETTEEIELTSKVDVNILEKIHSNISYEYEDIELTTIPAKVTATKLAKSKQEETFDRLEPLRIENISGFTPAQKGTILHTFMQYVNIENARKDLKEELSRIVNKGFLTKKESEQLNIKLVENFLKSNLCNRLLESDQVYREYQFIYEVNLTDIMDDISSKYSEETIVMQGIADTVFEEDDGFVIIDYKTDREKNEDVLKERYKDQLYIYKNALSRYFDKPIKQCLIYSLYLSKEIEV